MNLEFFIKLREMVSSGLVKMASTAQKTASAIKGANDNIGLSYDVIKSKIAQLEASIGKSTSLKHIRESRAELERLQSLARSHPSAMTRVSAKLETGGFMSGFMGLLRQALPALGIAGAMALGGNVLGAGLQAQSRQTSFEVMADKEQGTVLNKDLTKFAQDSIYGSEVYQASQTMLAFGANVKEVMPDLKMLGDIAIGDKERLGRLTLAFSQVRAAGKLMGQDLLQFVNAGFNPLQIMSEKTGISLGVLRKKVEEGQISFAMVKEAFQVATSAGGRFNNMTNKIAQTDFGKWEAFKGQLSGLAMQLGGAVAPAFGSLITQVSGFVGLLTHALSPSAEMANNAFKSQSEFVNKLTSEIVPIISRYEELTLKANLNKVEQTELSSIISKLNEQLPDAATKWDGLGRAVEFSSDKLRGLVGQSKEALKILNADAIKQNEKEVARRSIEANDLLFEIQNGKFNELSKTFTRLSQGELAAAQERLKGVYDIIGQTNNTIRSLQGLPDQELVLNQNIKNRTVKIGQPGFMDNLFGTGQKVVADLFSFKDKIPDNKKDKDANTKLPSSPTLGSFAGIKSDKEDEERIARGVTSGGPRVININGVKFAEKIEIHATTFEKGMDSVKDQLDEYMLRILNSGAAVQ